MIYLIGPDRRGAPIKLGIASHNDALRRRLATLQVGNPERLHLLNAYLCYDEDFDDPDRRYELLAHRAFSPARLCGEWFDPYLDVRIEHLARAPSKSCGYRIWQTLLPSAYMLPHRLNLNGNGAGMRHRAPLTPTVVNGLYTKPVPWERRRHVPPRDHVCQHRVPVAPFGGSRAA